MVLGFFATHVALTELPNSVEHALDAIVAPVRRRSRKVVRSSSFQQAVLTGLKGDSKMRRPHHSFKSLPLH